jgi:hypothetical protein
MLVIITLTTSMLAMIGPIFITLVLPSESSFLTQESGEMAESLRILDSISPFPTGVRAVCRLPEKPSRLVALGPLRILYYTSHASLVVAIVSMVVTLGVHLYFFVAPVAVTSSNCLGMWTNDDGTTTSDTFQEGYVWTGTPPFFNASAYEGTLTEDEVFKYRAHCRTNGMHPIIHRFTLNEYDDQWTEDTGTFFLNDGNDKIVGAYVAGKSQTYVTTYMNASVQTCGLALPFFCTVLGILIVKYCGQSDDDDADDNNPQRKTGSNPATAEHEFGFSDAKSAERIFLADAGIDEANLAQCAECFESSGLTIAVLAALKDDTIRQVLLEKAGISTAGDQAKILVHLASSK